MRRQSPSQILQIAATNDDDDGRTSPFQDQRIAADGDSENACRSSSKEPRRMSSPSHGTKSSERDPLQSIHTNAVASCALSSKEELANNTNCKLQTRSLADEQSALVGLHGESMHSLQPVEISGVASHSELETTDERDGVSSGYAKSLISPCPWSVQEIKSSELPYGEVTDGVSSQCKGSSENGSFVTGCMGSTERSHETEPEESPGRPSLNTTAVGIGDGSSKKELAVMSSASLADQELKCQEISESCMWRHSEQQPLSQSQGNVRASVTLLPSNKGRYHMQRGTGISKHVNGRGFGRAGKLAHLEVDGTVFSSHALSPRVMRSPYRKKSPIRWFPRSKTESYLERKIRLLQEKEGAIASLDETLGASNLHLSRIEREKLAARAAATEAIEARQAALIEASWCRILKLACIPCTSAILELQKAEKRASEALVEAANLGVILRNGPSSPRLLAELEPVEGVSDSEHTVTASLETAFDVDKEVTAAVKIALFHLSHLPDSGIKSVFDASFETENRHLLQVYCNPLLQRSNQKPQNTLSVAGKEDPQHEIKENNPGHYVRQQSTKELGEDRKVKDSDVEGNFLESDESRNYATETSSEAEYQSDSELEREIDVKDFRSDGGSTIEKQRQGGSAARRPARYHKSVGKPKVPQSLIELMEERVKGLDAEQHISLAGIVATRGLSALLKEQSLEQELCGRNSAVAELEESSVGIHNRVSFSKTASDLGSILVKHVPKIQREMQAAKESARLLQVEADKKPVRWQTEQKSESESLDKVLVKHLSRLEKEKIAALAAAAHGTFNSLKGTKSSKFVSEEHTKGLAEILKKPPQRTKNCNSHGLATDVQNKDPELSCAEETKKLSELVSSSSALVSSQQNATVSKESISLAFVSKTPKKGQSSPFENVPDLGSILVKHVSRLEREKQAAKNLTKMHEEVGTSIRKVQNKQASDEVLDKVLVKEKLSTASEAASALARPPKQVSVVEHAVVPCDSEECFSPERSHDSPSPGGSHDIEQLATWGSEDVTLDEASLKAQPSTRECNARASTASTSSLHSGSLGSAAAMDGCRIATADKIENGGEQALRETGLKKPSSSSEKQSSSTVEAAPSAGEDSRQRMKALRARQMEEIWGGLSLANTIQNGCEQDLRETGLKKLSSRLVTEKLASSTVEAAAAGEDLWQRKKLLRARQMEETWGGLSLGNALKRHVSKQELGQGIEQLATRGREDVTLDKDSLKTQPTANLCSGSLGSAGAIHDSRTAMAAKIENGGEQDEIELKNPSSSLEKLSSSTVEAAASASAGEDTWQRKKTLRARQMEETWGGLSLGNAIQNGCEQALRETGLRKLSLSSRLDMEKHASTVEVAAEDLWQRKKSLRARQMEETWGGLSLGNALKRHVSKLELEQATWRQAEEEARRRTNAHG